MSPARASALAAVLLAGTIVVAQCGCTHEEARPVPSAGGGDAPQLREDRRILELLQPCPQSSFYDRDLSDLVPVLLTKVEHAPPDPLKRAKEELGQLGRQAFPGIGNAFHSYFSDLMSSPYLENVVDALAFNPSDEAHELLIEALRHPQETVRSKALDGLGRLARPPDFELLVERLSIETPELRRHSVAPLFTADRTRAEALFLDAIGRGEERDLWIIAAPFLAESNNAETAKHCEELFPALDPLLASHLAAAAARFGLPGALEHLRGELQAEGLQRRFSAVEALRRAGLVDELRPALLEDPAGEVRAVAAGAFANAELNDERRGWLRTAMNDTTPQVQSEALRVLCLHGDEEGLARAVAQLDSQAGPLTSALLALREPLGHDSALVQTALERLMQRNALEEHRPIQQRTATFKAIGQIPRREAAEFLHTTGVAAADEKLESLRAHDWLMIQAANTGLEGRTYLVEALAAENDPERRIDLIDAIASTRDDLARTMLLELVEQRARSPLERLFAARALIRVGPSWEVAPRLKRVAFAMQGPDEAEARAALQCLLWQWY